jgi:SAM-dependent methyltransferase
VRSMASKTPSPSESVYYRHSGTLPLASRLSLHIRQKMFRMFMELMQPRPETSVLDVGVTSDELHQESNYFEQMYPYPHKITCVGTEDGSHLVRRYPGLKYAQIRSGNPLPFRDAEFDVVFSNAVIEHVGTREQQTEFIRDLCRVARHFFITTPNRWFPFEHHTGLPLLHYLPAGTFRTLLRGTRYQHWADESNLNILTAGELERLFVAGTSVQIRPVRLFGVTSNLVAFGATRE